MRVEDEDSMNWGHSSSAQREPLAGHFQEHVD